jgi:predicted DNA-binding ribbon-helix-helix protein
MTKRTVFIVDEIWKRLYAIAERDGIKVADLVRRAIVELLRREEKGE